MNSGLNSGPPLGKGVEVAVQLDGQLVKFFLRGVLDCEILDFFWRASKLRGGHRPENVLLTQMGVCRLADFRTAMAVEVPAAEGVARRALPSEAMRHNPPPGDTLPITCFRFNHCGGKRHSGHFFPQLFSLFSALKLCLGLVLCLD